MPYTAKQRSAMKKMSPKRRAAFKKMLNRAPAIGSIRPGKSRRRKKTAAKRKAAPKRKKAVRRAPARRKAAPKRKASARRSYTPNKLNRAQYMRRLSGKDLTKKQKEGLWKGYAKRTKQPVKPRPKPKTYAKGKFKALKARIGPKTRQTYKYRTKGGRVRDIPDYAILGYRSPKHENLLSQTDRGARAYVKRKERLEARRAKAAERAAERIRAGRGLFVPNKGDIITFEEWKKMRPNATKKQIAAARRNIKKAQAALREKRGGKRKTSKKKGTSRRKPKYGTKAWYKYIGKKGASARKRKGRKPARRKKATRKRRTRSISVGRKGHKVRISYAANRRRRYARKPRRRGRRRRVRRSYRRNVSAALFMTELKNALKLGALVTVGYVAHRAGTKVLSDHVFGRIDAFQTGGLAEYRNLISGAVMAAIGVPVTVRVAPKQAVPVAAGMAASLIHSAILLAMSKIGQADALPYLSAYPNASGPAYGSYYRFTPHQQMGQIPVMQAAAGMGQAPVMQAAAGMGQPMLAQAAAGMGEYYAYGASGVGEYEEVPTMTAGPVGAVDEGIYPNLHSAEQALTVAEAAAGVGNDVPLISTVNPTVIADPINELPGASRSGVFTGPDGTLGA